MINTTNTRKYSRVNYETQWKYINLEIKPTLYFQANTPVQDITRELQTRLNELYPDLNVNYEKSIPNFSRLYRNVLAEFKGWQVRYRKPGSKTDYGSISEKIGFTPRASQTRFEKTVFKKSMLWTHELYPLIDRVEIKTVSNCNTIAQRLNEKLWQPNYKLVLKTMKSNGLHVSEISKKLDGELVDLKNRDRWQPLLKNLQEINNYYELLSRFLNKNDYKIQGFNISEIFQKGKHRAKTAKGWRVEFLDKNN